METQEKIYAWKPIENLEGKFYLYSLMCDVEGLRIILVKYSDHTQGVLINFYGAFRSYRQSDDLLSMHSLEGSVEPYEGYKLPENPNAPQSPWSFFKIKNSEYLKWASYQSDGVSDDLNLTHYAFWTEDFTIEVLGWGEPEVSLVKVEPIN